MKLFRIVNGQIDTAEVDDKRASRMIRNGWKTEAPEAATVPEVEDEDAPKRRGRPPKKASDE